MSESKFPSPLRQNGRLYFSRREIEAYKRELLGLPPQRENSAIEELVPAAVVAKEFGFGRRTLGRRLAPPVGEAS